MEMRPVEGGYGHISCLDHWGGESEKEQQRLQATTGSGVCKRRKLGNAKILVTIFKKGGQLRRLRKVAITNNVPDL